MSPTLIHPTALVETAHVGNGTRIWAFVHILDGARLGSNCNIGDHCFIESDVVVGDNVTVKNGSMLFDGLRVDDGAFIGPGVVFANDKYPRSARLPQAAKRYGDRSWLLRTVVGKGVSIGAGAVIGPGVEIGNFATIGAGSTVTRNVLRHALVVGNPASFRGWVCECGLPLMFEAGSSICTDCGLAYIEEKGRVARTASEHEK